LAPARSTPAATRNRSPRFASVLSISPKREGFKSTKVHPRDLCVGLNFTPLDRGIRSQTPSKLGAIAARGSSLFSGIPCGRGATETQPRLVGQCHSSFEEQVWRRGLEGHFSINQWAPMTYAVHPPSRTAALLPPCKLGGSYVLARYPDVDRINIRALSLH
jgi:hypothetical protein